MLAAGRKYLRCAWVLLAPIALADELDFRRQTWGEVDGRPVYLYTLTNENGTRLQVTNFGARITTLSVKDQFGDFDDVVLGFDNLDDYLAPNPSFGAVVGRFANRIREARFTIEETTYALTRNEGEHHLHGAGEFENALWKTETFATADGPCIRLSYVSPDGSHGYPGRLVVHVTYTLTEADGVLVEFEAEADRPTHINLTQHSYFNLAGPGGSIAGHRVRLPAEYYQVMDGVLGTGVLEPVAGNAWDLTDWTRLGDSLRDIPLGGYHHYYFAGEPVDKLRLIAEVFEPQSGRTLKVRTTQPGVVFYAGMGLDGSLVGKGGVTYPVYGGFCLETQHPIDAANHPEFSGTLLRPGETYSEKVIYEFGVLGVSAMQE